MGTFVQQWEVVVWDGYALVIHCRACLTVFDTEETAHSELS